MMGVLHVHCCPGAGPPFRHCCYASHLCCIEPHPLVTVTASLQYLTASLPFCTAPSAVFRCYDPHFQPGSLDEASLDVTDCACRRECCGKQCLPV